MPGSAKLEMQKKKALNLLAYKSKKILGQEKVEQVEVDKIKLGEPDSSGRKSPIVQQGSEFKISADLVIKSLGFDPENLPTLFNAKELAISKWGTIKIN